MSDSAIDVLLDGWGEDDHPTEVIPPAIVDEAPEVEEEEIAAVPDDEPEQPLVEQPEEEEPEDEDEETTPEEEEEEDVAARSIEGFDLDDPEVIAYLAQYQDDPVKALRAAAELRRAFGRQGTELATARQKAQALENQMAQARLLQGGAPLSQEQVEWAEGAASSASPGAYVQQAISAGEFDLARAVCTYWAQADPFNAGRAGQLIDGVEQQMIQQTQQGPSEAPTEVILDALYTNVPGMREWEPQMVTVFQNLGPQHHLVQEARSNNIDVAMRALIQIFDIAKASTANVEETKTEIKKKARARADRAKAGAAVTSAANAPSTPAETPRDQTIMPGLTFGDLENAFAESS